MAGQKDLLLLSRDGFLPKLGRVGMGCSLPAQKADQCIQVGKANNFAGLDALNRGVPHGVRVVLPQAQ